MRLKLISDNSKQTTDCEQLQHKNTTLDLIQQPSQNASSMHLNIFELISLEFCRVLNNGFSGKPYQSLCYQNS